MKPMKNCFRIFAYKVQIAENKGLSFIKVQSYQHKKRN